MYHHQKPTTAIHCLKTYCLESGLFLEPVMSVTMLEQPIKVAVAITHVDKYNTRYE
jgi:hypothetical protein